MVFKRIFKTDPLFYFFHSKREFRFEKKLSGKKFTFLTNLKIDTKV